MTELSTALISDCLGRFQAMDAGIRLLVANRLSGPAFTVQTAAGENGTIHQALTHAPPGSVLVVDAGGYADRAVWGDIMTTAAQSVGLCGVVLDGAARDVAAIRRKGFPLAARAVCPTGPHKGWQGRIAIPVQCGGVVVNPGDLVYGDEDGIVIVPAKEHDSVLAAANARADLESEWTTRIAAGESSAAILGVQRSATVTGQAY